MLGESITQGMELVFARENWTVAGRKVEMIKEDDEMKPPVGIRKTEKLIDSDKVDILTGPVHSGILLGMRDKVHASKTILIVSNAGADDISRAKCSKWIFRTSFSNWQPNWPMGPWVAKNVSKEVFVAAPNYQAGKDQMGAFKESFLASGGKVIGEDYPKLRGDRLCPVPDEDQAVGGQGRVRLLLRHGCRGLREAVRRVRPQAVGEAHGRRLPRRARRAARPGQVGPRHHQRALLHAPPRQSDERALREGIPRQVRGKMPDGFACQGYDTAETIVRAVKATSGNTQDKEKLVAVIEKTEFDSPRGHFRFDPKTHNVIQPLHLRPRGEGSGRRPQQRPDRQGRRREGPRRWLHAACVAGLDGVGREPG